MVFVIKIMINTTKNYSYRDEQTKSAWSILQEREQRALIRVNSQCFVKGNRELCVCLSACLTVGSKSCRWTFVKFWNGRAWDKKQSNMHCGWSHPYPVPNSRRSYSLWQRNMAFSCIITRLQEILRDKSITITVHPFLWPKWWATLPWFMEQWNISRDISHITGLWEIANIQLSLPTS